MPFNFDGRFTPSQLITAQQSQAASPSKASLSSSMARFNPAFRDALGSFTNTTAPVNGTPSYQPTGNPVQWTPQQQINQPIEQYQNPVPQQQDLQNIAATQFQNQYAQQVPMQSFQQMAAQNNSNPQNVSNYLATLNRIGTGNTNGQFNSIGGQQGQGPVAGFQGFQTNGGNVQQLGYVGYTGPMQSNVGYQNNGSQLGQGRWQQNVSIGGNYGKGPVQYAGGGGVQQGGTGGMIDQYGHAKTNVSFGGVNGQPKFAPDWYPIKNPKLTAPSFNDPNYSGGNNNSNTVTGPNLNLTTSDENAKTEISAGQGDLQEFLDALGVYSYEYKDPEAHGEGRRISPMAQEMEASKLGKEFVFDVNGTKAVDYGKMAGTQLAATALLNSKIKRQEKLINDLKNKVSEILSKKK